MFCGGLARLLADVGTLGLVGFSLGMQSGGGRATLLSKTRNGFDTCTWSACEIIGGRTIEGFRVVSRRMRPPSSSRRRQESLRHEDALYSMAHCHSLK